MIRLRDTAPQNIGGFQNVFNNCKDQELIINLISLNQRNAKKKRKFFSVKLTAAVEAVVNEGMSKKSVAKKFSVSRSTLQHRLKNPDQKVSCGPAPVLSEEEEKTLEKWILESSRKGFPQRKDDLLVSVKQYLDKNERITIFKNNQL